MNKTKPKTNMKHTTNYFIPEITSILNREIEKMHNNQPDKMHQLFSTPEGWVIRIDLPGYNKSDLTLQFKDDTLTLKANNESRGEKALPFALGSEVKVDDINARLENGVLEISLPKREESLPNSHEISIN